MSSERTHWWPALDGLRAVAVLGVLLYHHDPDWLPGGFLGVSLFFTLSGFLLTTLVVREHERTGTIGLRHFWIRRVRRLAPVALLGLAVALVVATTTLAADRISDAARDIPFAALNVANWRFLAKSATYGDALSAPSPVLHYWSLAIEEQFYVVFPLIAGFALRRSRALLAGVFGAVVAVSLFLQLQSTDFNRIYFGTDTRAAELAIGCLAALAWHAWGSRARARWLDLLGGAALIVLVYTWWRASLATSALYRGGLVVHALLSAVLIVCAIGGRLVTRALSSSWLHALGRISYGVYVLHFPMFAVMTSERTNITNEAALFVVRVAVVVAAATFVHWAIEAPVRWRQALPRRQGAVAFAAGVGAMVVLASGVVVVNRPAEVERASTIPVLRMTLPSATSTLDATTEAEADAAAGHLAGGAAVLPAAPPPIDAATAAAGPAPLPVPRVLVVGDSTALFSGKGLQQWAATNGVAEFDIVADFGCTLYHEGRLKIRTGWVGPESDTCVNLMDSAVAAANEIHPDLVLVFIGSIQLADWELPGESQWRGMGDPMLDSQYVLAADKALTQLESIGVPVLFADVPVPAWDLPDGQLAGHGTPTINNVDRTDAINRLNTAVVAPHQGVRQLAYAESLERPDRSVDTAIRPDGLHLSVDGVRTIMDAWLLDMLVAAYRDVVTTLPSTETRPTTWAPA